LDAPEGITDSASSGIHEGPLAGTAAHAPKENCAHLITVQTPRHGLRQTQVLLVVVLSKEVIGLEGSTVMAEGEGRGELSYRRVGRGSKKKKKNSW